MPLVSIDLNMKRIINNTFVEKANACKPELKETIVRPSAIVDIQKDGMEYPTVSMVDTFDNIRNYHMKKGDKLFLDFGDHQVGYVTLTLSSVGSPQDAPAYFRLKFGEIAKEMVERSEDYDGWISRGWIQEEYIHIDVLPVRLELPRRYAFRYLEIETIDTSLKWQMVVDDVMCRSVSCVDAAEVEPFDTEDEMLKKMDQVSIRT
ncbi:MAG: cellobiose phosphorylase, partial [Lachnospiraceae bacterium]